MFTNALPSNTALMLEKLKNKPFLSNFYLSAGTALALQMGYRESEDLGFFTKNEFDPDKLQIELEKIVKLEDFSKDKGTLNCFANYTKLQFLYYPYLLLEPLINWHGIFISSSLDIACTKLVTISDRGSKKDFIDLYFLLEEYDLAFLFEKLKNKYSNTDYTLVHILKSLIYFEDAEKQPMPRMHKKVEWEKVKIKITKEVKEFKF